MVCPAVMRTYLPKGPDAHNREDQSNEDGGHSRVQRHQVSKHIMDARHAEENGQKQAAKNHAVADLLVQRRVSLFIGGNLIVGVVLWTTGCRQPRRLAHSSGRVIVGDYRVASWPRPE